MPSAERPNQGEHAEFRDPVPGYEGRWLAGFAPVGKTDYVVAVQTRDAALSSPPLVIGGLLLNLSLFALRRREV